MKKSIPVLAASLLAATGFAASVVQAAGPVGEVTHLSGLLTTKRADGSTRVFAVRSQVQEGDTLNTEQDTYARVKFADGSEVVLRPASQVKVESFKFDKDKPESDNVLINMFKGGMRAVTGLIGKRNRDAVNFATATATVGIRGTHFSMLLCQNDCGSIIMPATGKPPPNGMHVDVADGAVVMKTPGGAPVQINSGQSAYAQNAQSTPVIVPQSESVKVTMPVSISQNAASRALGKNGTSCDVQ